MMEEVLTAMTTIHPMAHHQATEMDQVVQVVDQSEEAEMAQGMDPGMDLETAQTQETQEDHQETDQVTEAALKAEDAQEEVQESTTLT